MSNFGTIIDRKDKDLKNIEWFKLNRSDFFIDDHLSDNGLDYISYICIASFKKDDDKYFIFSKEDYNLDFLDIITNSKLDEKEKIFTIEHDESIFKIENDLFLDSYAKAIEYINKCDSIDGLKGHYSDSISFVADVIKELVNKRIKKYSKRKNKLDADLLEEDLKFTFNSMSLEKSSLFIDNNKVIINHLINLNNNTSKFENFLSKKVIYDIIEAVKYSKSSSKDSIIDYIIEHSFINEDNQETRKNYLDTINLLIEKGYIRYE